jgi:cytochrome oxidase assembly protein ShyY1
MGEGATVSVGAVTDHRDIVASPAAAGRPPTDWAFARRPGWILSHLFVLGCVLAFLLLANWQLDRLGGRRDVNRMIEAREQSAPVPIDTLVQPTDAAAQANAFTFRPVTVTGTYDTANQVLIRNRTRNSSDPGWWLITPLVSADGRTAVAVNRGWVPYAIDENSSLAEFAPPTGTVTVTGLVMSTQNRESGPYDPADGVLRTLSRVDLIRFQHQLPYQLYPVYVSLSSSQPPQSGPLPDPVPPPELGDGPHLNYAGQWLIFATLTVIVYPLLLRRRARDKGIERAEREAEARAEPTSTPVGS